MESKIKVRREAVIDSASTEEYITITSRDYGQYF